MSSNNPNLTKSIKKINKPLASVKIAVFIILALAVVTAVGTIIEARYDAFAAKKLVYDTWIVYSLMILLAVNLIAVMIDRWPWKRRHAAFVSAHIGIIIILIGSWLTMQYGLDGSMRVEIGESSNLVQTPETDIIVYSSFDGDRYSKIFEEEVDFFSSTPTKERPFIVPAFDAEIRVIDYKKYVLPSRVVSEDKDGKGGAGLRFQIQNPNVNVVEWIVQKKPTSLAAKDFGPAQFNLGKAPDVGLGKNEVYFTPKGDKVEYVVFSKESQRAIKRGLLKEGDVFDPGFKMKMDVRLLRYFPSAAEDWDVKVVERPTPLTTSALRVLFEGREHWVLLNDVAKLFTSESVYLFTYGNRRVDIRTPIKLKDFKVTHYQGTLRAMAYESVVDVTGQGERVISMNEPLKHQGLTIYQSSFQEENGRPIASIFSVNHDPGRFLKYLGSLVMSIGIVLLMWFKHLDFKLSRKKEQDLNE